VPDVFWREFRPVVRRANPDAVIIGEIWDDAGRWLQGDMFDSVMNYVWRAAVLGFVAHRSLTPSQFDQRMAQLQVMYPRQSLYAMYNMLSSHDTPRFRRECGGDLNRVRLGLLLQFTAIGAPAIYYGDEIGMDGGGIPDNRRPMRFERTPDEQAMFEYTRALIALRKGSVALRRGEWTTVLVDDARGLYGFVRHTPDDAALVLVNVSDQPQRATVSAWNGVPQWAHAVSTHTPTQTTYTAVQGRITVDLPPLSGTVLVPSSKSPIGGKTQ